MPAAPTRVRPIVTSAGAETPKERLGRAQAR
jgi:hypothetical protein